MWMLTHGHKLRINWGSKVWFTYYLFLCKVNCILTCCCGHFAERKSEKSQQNNHWLLTFWIYRSLRCKCTSTDWFLFTCLVISSAWKRANICCLVVASVSSPAASAIRVWACSSLCISVLTECKETLTQGPFPHRDRYAVYILLFSIIHILQERF